MAGKGLALHIGLNFVDKDHYDGWDGELAACEFDAKDMHAITKKRGYAPTLLLRQAATRGAVLAWLKDAASHLEDGDTCVVSYSGHGGQVRDATGSKADEIDGLDETWCLYDGELIDDELAVAWADFKGGVRILVLSDSCHSGTVVKQAYRYGLPLPQATITGTPAVTRDMPIEVARRVYEKHQAFYDSLQKTREKAHGAPIAASVVLISGCQDNQLSQDGTWNGLFTGMLLRVWDEGSFKGSLGAFHKKIRAQMPPDQTPNFYRYGPRNAAFEKAGPFAL